MAQVTIQYLQYVEQIRERNLELAAEYSLMASLIEIVTRRHAVQRKNSQGDDDNDPRADLVRRLLEYEQIAGCAASRCAAANRARFCYTAGLCRTKQHPALPSDVNVTN